MSTKLIDYDYYLPEELIGQHPTEPRDHSRLMIVDKKNETTEDKHFYDIIDYLNEGDVLVRNSTKVIPARLFGKKETGAVLNTWECLVGHAKKLKIGQKVYIGNNNELIGELVEIKDDGNRIIKFYYEGVFEEVLDHLGRMPLPPYIVESLEDQSRYQTVYAIKGESVAAPTAGLHFTKELLKKIEDKGITIVDIFLEVGLGTFRPVQTEDVLDHKMHEERFEIPKEACEIINKAKKEGRRIVAVGTTTVRALESAGKEDGTLEAESSSTDIFIYPGYKFKIIDALITNFHLPKSTLLMLVSAFSSREFMLKVYKEAVEKKYHFFSFGDAMFIY